MKSAGAAEIYTWSVKRKDAIDRCAELNRDRERQWFAKQVAPDDWELVSVAAPEPRSRGPRKEAGQARPQPSKPADPRAGHRRP